MRVKQRFTSPSSDLRVRPWHPDARIAHLTPVGPMIAATAAQLEQCVQDLRIRGYRGAITSALQFHELRAFHELGFYNADRLVVLSKDLTRPDFLDVVATRPVDAALSLRRARSRHHPEVLRIDHSSFPLSWQLDSYGLYEAMNATHRHRFRIASISGQRCGYAITGLSESVSFLQRLATSPSFQHRGVATALVRDALVWAKTRGANSMLVNTQATNTAALGLYKALGFETTPSDLHVLRLDFNAERGS